MPFDLVVFDMAGTTVDEDNVVYKTLQRAINEAGYPVTLAQVLAQGAGHEKSSAARNILKVYAGVEDEALVQRIYDRFMGYLEEAYRDLPMKPEPHAEEIFTTLRNAGVKVVLNTGYQSSTARDILGKLGWSAPGTVDGLVTATDVSRARPFPDMILLAMERLGLSDAARVAKIGDSMIDVEEGKNAGCGLTVGITTGAHTRAQLEVAAPDHIIGDLAELPALLGL